MRRRCVLSSAPPQLPPARTHAPAQSRAPCGGTRRARLKPRCGPRRAGPAGARRGSRSFRSPPRPRRRRLCRSNSSSKQRSPRRAWLMQARGSGMLRQKHRFPRPPRGGSLRLGQRRPRAAKERAEGHRQRQRRRAPTAARGVGQQRPARACSRDCPPSIRATPSSITSARTEAAARSWGRTSHGPAERSLPSLLTVTRRPSSMAPR